MEPQPLGFPARLLAIQDHVRRPKAAAAVNRLHGRPRGQCLPAHDAGASAAGSCSAYSTASCSDIALPSAHVADALSPRAARWAVTHWSYSERSEVGMGAPMA